MRLIDADALINRVVFHTDWSLDEKAAFEDEVNAEPTIEPEQKTGKWLIAEKDRYIVHSVRCSVCGYCISWMANYCPDCGAKMEA